MEEINISKKVEIPAEISSLDYTHTEVLMSQMKMDGTWRNEDKTDWSDKYRSLIAHRANLESKS